MPSRRRRRQRKKKSQKCINDMSLEEMRQRKDELMRQQSNPSLPKPLQEEIDELTRAIAVQNEKLKKLSSLKSRVQRKPIPSQPKSLPKPKPKPKAKAKSKPKPKAKPKEKSNSTQVSRNEKRTPEKLNEEKKVGSPTSRKYSAPKSLIFSVPKVRGAHVTPPKKRGEKYPKKSDSKYGIDFVNDIKPFDCQIVRQNPPIMSSLSESELQATAQEVMEKHNSRLNPLHSFDLVDATRASDFDFDFDFGVPNGMIPAPAPVPAPVAALMRPYPNPMTQPSLASFDNMNIMPLNLAMLPQPNSVPIAPVVSSSADDTDSIASLGPLNDMSSEAKETAAAESGNELEAMAPVIDGVEQLEGVPANSASSDEEQSEQKGEDIGEEDPESSPELNEEETPGQPVPPISVQSQPLNIRFLQNSGHMRAQPMHSNPNLSSNLVSMQHTLLRISMAQQQRMQCEMQYKQVQTLALASAYNEEQQFLFVKQMSALQEIIDRLSDEEKTLCAQLPVPRSQLPPVITPQSLMQAMNTVASNSNPPLMPSIPIPSPISPNSISNSNSAPHMMRNLIPQPLGLQSPYQQNPNQMAPPVRMAEAQARAQAQAQAVASSLYSYSNPNSSSDMSRNLNNLNPSSAPFVPFIEMESQSQSRVRNDMNDELPSDVMAEISISPLRASLPVSSNSRQRSSLATIKEVIPEHMSWGEYRQQLINKIKSVRKTVSPGVAEMMADTLIHSMNTPHMNLLRGTVALKKKLVAIAPQVKEFRRKWKN